MRRTPSAPVAIAGHLAIGMAVGVVLALGLLLGSDTPIFRLIFDGSSPVVALALYFGLFAMTFGLGSTLTGLLLDATDEPGTSP
jgi:hypothetical protein